MKQIFYYVWVILILTSACRKSDYEIPQKEIVLVDHGNGLNITTWTNDKKYILDGFVYVNDGQTLVIEEGTVIHAKTGQGTNASALIVCRGGKIIARGTKEKPIIFTVVGDDLEGSVPLFSRGLWGGVIILGNAPINTNSGEAHIEGIPFSENRGLYGGNNPQDNSGILEYVSIRHGGTNIGNGNEINGLTLGGVGSGTVINYLEVISNADDGIEFFGGNVNCKYIISSLCEDDAFDFDQGYAGYGQYFLAIQDPAVGDMIAEHNGGYNPACINAYTYPKIYNATFVGRGNDILSLLMDFADHSAGLYSHSIFINQGFGLNIEYKDGNLDAYYRLTNGNLVVQNNVFWDIADNHTDSFLCVYNHDGKSITSQKNYFINHFNTNNNKIINPGLEIKNRKVKVFPDFENSGYPIQRPDNWFEQVDFVGAFKNNNWADEWSLSAKSELIK